MMSPRAAPESGTALPVVELPVVEPSGCTPVAAAIQPQWPRLRWPGVAQNIRQRAPGKGLERNLYTGADTFDADLDLIFSRHWIFVGVAPQVAEPGDTITLQIGPHPILILRDDDGVVRAFHNVCRHRGARLCREASGSVGRLVCPYHQWTYELDGRLVRTGQMGPDFDPDAHHLRPVHLRNLAGLLYICLAETPPDDFDALAQAMTPYLEPHRLEDCKVAASIDLIEEGNWKITMENNRECYHCMGSHPELTRSIYAAGFGYVPGQDNDDDVRALEEATRESEVRWNAHALPFAEIERLDGTPTGYRTQRLPIARYGESQTMDTRVACRRLLGAFTEARLGGLSFWTQPNAWHHFMSDHIVCFSVLPLAPDRTLLRTFWLVHRDAEEGVDYTVERLTRVWRATNEQDGLLVGEQQRGVSSPAYVPGPYSPDTEALVEKFACWYVERMRAGFDGPAASPGGEVRA